MPRKSTKATAALVKKPAKKSSPKQDEMSMSEITTPERSSSILPGPISFLNNKKAAFAVLGVGLLALLYVNKSWFVAATVNGQPIFTQQVNEKLNASYKQQVLNQMVNETVLQQEAAKNHITISDDEVNKQIQSTESNYGGKDAFMALLSQQGVNYDEFVKQTKLQLIAEKLYANDINPTDDEIKKWEDENSTLPEASDEAKFKTLAQEQLKQQKLSQVFSQKFQDLRKSANVQIF